VWLGIRPEHFEPGPAGAGMPGVIQAVETTGSQSFLAIDLDGVGIASAHSGTVRYREGDAIGLHVKPHQVYVFDHQSEQSL